jgi:hypothetical protein
MVDGYLMESYGMWERTNTHQIAQFPQIVVVWQFVRSLWHAALLSVASTHQASHDSRLSPQRAKGGGQRETGLAEEIQDGSLAPADVLG